MDQKSTAGRFILHRSTGSFQGTVAHGSAEVQVFAPDDPTVPPPPGPSFGQIMLQRQAGHIIDSP